MDNARRSIKLVCRRPWWWVAPLLVLALLLAALGNARIQRDLVNQAKRSLSGADIDGVRATTRGQELTLRGPSGVREAAIAAGRNITGVRKVKYVVDTDGAPEPTVAAAETTTATSANVTTTVQSATTPTTSTTADPADPARAADLVGPKLSTLNARTEINFENNADVLTDESKATLDQAVPTVTEILAASDTVGIEIGGHTDSVGSDAANLALSQRRADAVLAYLIDNGVDANRVSAVGYGETKPKVGNATAEGKATNRRIEFTVSGS